MLALARPLAAVLICLSCLSGCDGDGEDGGSSARSWAFVPNSFAYYDDPANWRTPYGPAYADVQTASTQFLPCLGGPGALCYYSGPDPVPCIPTQNGRFANCTCFEIPWGRTSCC